MLAAPFELMEHVRMAVCADPEGVVFSLAQQRAHPGVERGNGAVSGASRE